MSKLVLVRHGESLWNKLNIFTGWVDVPLSEKGVKEALEAGGLLKDYKFDVIFTSELVRAIQTVMLIMSKNSSGVPRIIHDEGRMKEWGEVYGEHGKNYIPVYKAWQLNFKIGQFNECSFFIFNRNTIPNHFSRCRNIVRYTAF